MSDETWNRCVSNAVERFRELLPEVPSNLGRVSIMGTGIKIEDFIEHVLRAAGEAEASAGFSGLHSDGGAKVVALQLAAWVAGVRGKVPEQFEGYAEEIETQKDPEYKEYLRLKEKFEKD